MNMLGTGQVWSLRGCSSRAAVHALETLGDEDIVHVSILDSGGEVRVGHMPFARLAFLNSADQIVATVAPETEFREGYAYWRAEFEKGAAGVYAIDVCEALSL
jgi:hypothetical protein